MRSKYTSQTDQVCLMLKSHFYTIVISFGLILQKVHFSENFFIIVSFFCFFGKTDSF